MPQIFGVALAPRVGRLLILLWGLKMSCSSGLLFRVCNLTGFAKGSKVQSLEFWV